eukprot:4320356-Amphidinium_carterae.1
MLRLPHVPEHLNFNLPPTLSQVQRGGGIARVVHQGADWLIVYAENDFGESNLSTSMLIYDANNEIPTEAVKRATETA